MKRFVPFTFVVLAMVSCSQAEPENDAAGAEPAECGAPDQQNLVGLRIEDLGDVTFPATVTRFINPGDAITQDFRPERLNIEFAEDGAISRVYCG